jgi:hypothetical protein
MAGLGLGGGIAPPDALLARLSAALGGFRYASPNAQWRLSGAVVCCSIRALAAIPVDCRDKSPRSNREWIRSLAQRGPSVGIDSHSIVSGPAHVLAGLPDHSLVPSQTGGFLDFPTTLDGYPSRSGPRFPCSGHCVCLRCWPRRWFLWPPRRYQRSDHRPDVARAALSQAPHSRRPPPCGSGGWCGGTTQTDHISLADSAPLTGR